MLRMALRVTLITPYFLLIYTVFPIALVHGKHSSGSVHMTLALGAGVCPILWNLQISPRPYMSYTVIKWQTVSTAYSLEDGLKGLAQYRDAALSEGRLGTTSADLDSEAVGFNAACIHRRGG